MSDLNRSLNEEEQQRLRNLQGPSVLDKDLSIKDKIANAIDKTLLETRDPNSPYSAENLVSGFVGGGINKIGQEAVNAARLARAAEMGFGPETYYHGTTSNNIQKFDPNFMESGATFFTKDPNFANDYTKGATGNNGTVYPVKLRLQNTFDYENPEHINRIKKYLDPSKYDLSGVKSGKWEYIENPNVQNAIKNSGFDSFHVNENGVKNVAIYDPSGIRSVNADFDPTQKNSSNILAGAIAAPNGIINKKDPGYAEGGVVQADNLVNVFTPEGDLASLPAHQLTEALDSGFRQASPEEYQQYQEQQKYGTLPEQIKTGLEGAGQAATFGLSTGIEKQLGVNGEDILARERVNPVSHGIGQVAGLVGSSLIAPELGATKLLTGAGEGAAGALGLAGEGALSKIGSAGVRNAVETMMLTGGDEVSKMLAGDPDQSIQTALTNVGLSGLIAAPIGGAFGAVNPLWKATAGPKVTQFLDLLSKKSEGIEGIIPDALSESMRVSGIEAPGEVKALLSDSPMAREMAQNLLESGTASGTKAREAFEKFRGNVSNATLEALGKNEGEIANIPNISKYDSGQDIKNSLVKTLKESIDPISQKYEDIKSKFSGLEMNDVLKSKIGTEIGEMSEREGFNLSPASAQSQAVRTILNELPNLKTLEDLRKYQSIVSDKTFANPELRRVGKLLNGIFREAEEGTVKERLSSESPQLLGQHEAARGAYRNAMGLIDELNNRLHVGRYGGPSGFIRNLSEMDPETILKRLADKNDAGLLENLQNKFPEVANKVRDYHLNTLLDTASRRANGEEIINPKVLFDSISKMTPEMRQFVFPQETLQKLDGLQKIIETIPQRKNPSGTASTLDALWKRVPNTAIGMATLLSGHGAGFSLLTSVLGPNILREGEDAVKLGLLKYLGNGQHISAEGFQGMVKYIDSIVKGENLLTNSIKNIFKAGSIVVPEKFLPTPKKREMLDKKLDSLRQDPSPLFDVGGTTTVYLPEHGEAIGSVASNAVQYLQSVKPSEDKQNPLDKKPKISDAIQSQYNRTLDIAEQPLVILNHIKEGTLQPQDVMSLHTMYPSLYQKMQSKISYQLVNAIDKNIEIPYKTKMSLSMFLGSPLDSTMTPFAIQSTMASYQQPVDQPQGMKPKHSFTQLNKLGAINMTTQQDRESRHLKG